MTTKNNIDLNDNQYWVWYRDYVWKGQRDDDGVWLKENYNGITKLRSSYGYKKIWIFFCDWECRLNFDIDILKFFKN